MLVAVAACGGGAAGPGTNPDAAIPVPDGAGAPTVSRYGIFEPSFSWPSAGYSDPFAQVTLTVTFTPPIGAPVTIGGFYAAADTWQARFSPDRTGTWTWSATIGDGTSSAQSSGSFVVVDGGQPGFMRLAPDRPTRWVTDDGSPFWPIGFNDCIVTVSGDALSVDKYWGFDGPAPGCTDGKCERRVDIDTYLAAYRDAGFNVFRWGIGLCGFDVKKSLGSDGYVLGAEESAWGDELLRKLRQYGFHVYLTLYAFDYRPPASSEANRKYVKYVVDRYGAYVDSWELTNEFPNPPETIADDWYTQTAAYVRSLDPYRHPIGTSWERPDLPAIDINAPHWYQTEDELDADSALVAQVDRVRAEARGRVLPIVFGEQGNTGVNWYPSSALRMRIRIWTALFDEAAILFWNESSTIGKCPPQPAECNNPAANIYLGPTERSYVKVWSDFTRGLDAGVVAVPAHTNAPDRVRGYAMRSATTYAAYLHAYTDHTNPTTGVTLTVEPLAAGTATWIAPASGAVLGTQPVAAAQQTLAVPAFTVDVALRIVAGGSR
jgi:hypothetical protein